MSRKTEVKSSQVERKRTIVYCDICKKEISPDIISMQEEKQNKYKIWWTLPLDLIAHIRKDTITSDYEYCDYDVHVECAYLAVQKAVKEAQS